MKLYKYPKTPYLIWSPGRSDRDWRVFDTGNFDGQRVAMTWKMDGENITMYRDRLHARSLNWVPTAWRQVISKIFWDQVAYRIPQTIRICGESMEAVHSIYYDNLPAYFLVHSVWEGDLCLSYYESREWASSLGLTYVPEYLSNYDWDREFFKNMSIPDNCEGYVLRNMNEFKYKDFDKNVAKCVRRGHVQTDEHWTKKKLAMNKLKP